MDPPGAHAGQPLDAEAPRAEPEIAPDMVAPGLHTMRWTWWDVVLGLMPLVLAKTLAPWQPQSWPGVVGLYALMFGLIGWMLFFPFFVCRRRGHQAVQRIGWTRLALEAAWALATLIVIYVVLVAAVLIGYVVGGERALPRDVLENARYSPNLTVTLALALVLACTITPLSEEVFFRGFLFSALRQRMTLIAALVVQAGLFALLHFQPLINQLYLFLIGLILGAVYAWRQTLWAPIFTHVMFNGLAVIAVVVSILQAGQAPILGVSCTDREGQPGCVVQFVGEGSPAAAAGLEVGDVITAIDGQPVADFRHLIRFIRAQEVGQEVTIHFLRDGQEWITTAVLRRRE